MLALSLDSDACGDGEREAERMLTTWSGQIYQFFSRKRRIALFALMCYASLC
jgi:hypothetical protein